MVGFVLVFLNILWIKRVLLGINFSGYIWFFLFNILLYIYILDSKCNFLYIVDINDDLKVYF